MQPPQPHPQPLTKVMIFGRTLPTPPAAALASLPASSANGEKNGKRSREEVDDYEDYKGYALKLSQNNGTGYAGVARQKKSQVNPFQAFALGAKGKYLGSFPTAREAALAVAKHAAGEAVERPARPLAARPAARRLASPPVAQVAPPAPAPPIVGPTPLAATPSSCALEWVGSVWSL